jgi:hypothetical protein
MFRPAARPALARADAGKGARCRRTLHHLAERRTDSCAQLAASAWLYAVYVFPAVLEKWPPSEQECRLRLRALRDSLIAQRVKTADGSGLARNIDCSGN